MADKIDAVPEKTRWEIATKGMTGAYIAISNAFKQAVGQKKFEEFNGSLWYEAGKGAKEFADSVGLKAETAGDVEGAMHLLAQASMGPEFKFEVVESTNDRCVGTPSAPGTRGGKSKALISTPAAWGTRSGAKARPRL